MIWLMLAAMLVLVLAYLTVPFWPLGDDEAHSTHRAVAEVREQLVRIDGELEAGRITEATAQETRRALELRVLALLDRGADDSAPARLGPLWGGGLIAGLFCVGTIGLYAYLGTPTVNLQGVSNKSVQTAESDQNTPSLESLVAELETKLAADPSPPVEGYILLARSRMTLGRYQVAFTAYEMALQLSEQDPVVLDEFQRARAYVDAAATAPGPDAAAIANAEAMSPEERQIMIDGMVAGLAARLREAPDDPDGWVQLIRARLVLGQTDAARADLAEAVRAFEEQPDKRAFVIEAADRLGLSLVE